MYESYEVIMVGRGNYASLLPSLPGHAQLMEEAPWQGIGFQGRETPPPTTPDPNLENGMVVA